MLGLGIEKLRQSRLVDQVVVSTESELVARIAHDFGALVLPRPPELAEDDVPSIPVFQHIVEHFPCDIHVNLNINFPTCQPAVVDRAVEHAQAWGEALSVPYAVWAQSVACLVGYGDPWDITARTFEDPEAGVVDIHTEAELLDVYRQAQGELKGWPSLDKQAPGRTSSRPHA